MDDEHTTSYGGMAMVVRRAVLTVVYMALACGALMLEPDGAAPPEPVSAGRPAPGPTGEQLALGGGVEPLQVLIR